jgi:hypothetical protein
MNESSTYSPRIYTLKTTLNKDIRGIKFLRIFNYNLKI